MKFQLFIELDQYKIIVLSVTSSERITIWLDVISVPSDKSYTYEKFW